MTTIPHIHGEKSPSIFEISHIISRLSREHRIYRKSGITGQQKIYRRQSHHPCHAPLHYLWKQNPVFVSVHTSPRELKSITFEDYVIEHFHFFHSRHIIPEFTHQVPCQFQIALMEITWSQFRHQYSAQIIQTVRHKKEIPFLKQSLKFIHTA